MGSTLFPGDPVERPHPTRHTWANNIITPAEGRRARPCIGLTTNIDGSVRLEGWSGHRRAAVSISILTKRKRLSLRNERGHLGEKEGANDLAQRTQRFGAVDGCPQM